MVAGIRELEKRNDEKLKRLEQIKLAHQIAVDSMATGNRATNDCSNKR